MVLWRTLHLKAYAYSMLEINLLRIRLSAESPWGILVMGTGMAGLVGLQDGERQFPNQSTKSHSDHSVTCEIKQNQYWPKQRICFQ